MVLGARTATLSQDDSLKGGGAPLTDILALPEVGGALVGGASLKAGDFEAIFRAVLETV